LNRQGRQERQGNQTHDENQTAIPRIRRDHERLDSLCIAVTLLSIAILGVPGDLGGSI
jgi:hypothetical protein